MSFLGRTPSNAPLTTADIPDGIIVAADLAPNSVDSSELVDGSIDTSHIADNQVTLAKMAGGTDGNLITYDTSGDPAYVATGTSGHVLTSAGADAVPTFQAAAGFASGTKMIFNQTAAPTGWTKVTGSGNDTALRVTTGTVGTGGSVAFETAFADKTFTPTISQPTASGGTVSGHTLTKSEEPDDYVLAGSGYSTQHYNASSDTHIGTGNNQGFAHGSSHSHGMGQPTISTPTSNAVPIDLNVSFVDVIIATKD